MLFVLDLFELFVVILFLESEHNEIEIMSKIINAFKFMHFILNFYLICFKEFE